MKLKNHSTEQKLKGAYYTPRDLAQIVVRELCDKNHKRVLEPSCGDGAFIDAMNAAGCLTNATSVTAVEVDEKPLALVYERYGSNENFKCICDDFFNFYSDCEQGCFDLVIGNPPYIRYQYLEPSQRALMSSILTQQGMHANKLINAWVGFMVACTNLLRDRGQMIFVIPAEVMQVAYAEDLRLFLATHYSEITLLSFEKLVFDGIEQEVIIFVGRKGSDDSRIRIVQTLNTESLGRVDFSEIQYQKLSRVHEKWTKYFISADDSMILESLKTDRRLASFSDLAIINVGITTGNNKFFSLDDETSAKYGLDDLTMPLIGRSSHASGVYFTAEDWDNNRAKGKRARLLVLENGQYSALTKSQKSYIDKGEKLGENDGYKCRIRESWYAVPSVWIPDAFFLRRNNLYPKFVLNRCGAVSTDTMHRILFRDGISGELALLSYYNSVSFAFTELCGRSYGGGVLEILPREVGNMLVPRVSADDIDETLARKIIEKIDEILRNDGDIEVALDLVDQRLLVDILGFEPAVCSACRRVWKTLQSRRLSRGEA